MFCRPLSNYPPSHCHSEIFLLSLNLNTQPHEIISIQADIRWWQWPMIGLVLASIWLLFMTISPGLYFSVQALTRQTRPGLLSNLRCPSLLWPLMNSCRLGEIRKLIQKICPEALKYFGVRWSSWWHVPTHHDLMLTHLTLPSTVYSLESDLAIIVMWEFGHFWHCLKLDISAKSSE